MSKETKRRIRVFEMRVEIDEAFIDHIIRKKLSLGEGIAAELRALAKDLDKILSDELGAVFAEKRYRATIKEEEVPVPAPERTDKDRAKLSAARRKARDKKFAKHMEGR